MSRGRGTGSMWRMAVVGAALVTACDSATIPALPVPYDFRLAIYGADGSARQRTFHWHRGTVVPVYVDDEPEGAGALRQAFRQAVRAWRSAAVFGEVRLRETNDLGEARAVLRWHDAVGVLSTPMTCVGPVTGAASTLGCLNDPATRCAPGPAATANPRRSSTAWSSAEPTTRSCSIGW